MDDDCKKLYDDFYDKYKALSLVITKLNEAVELYLKTKYEPFANRIILTNKFSSENIHEVRFEAVLKGDLEIFKDIESEN